MMVGKGCDLWQMGDAKHLLRPRELLQLLAHRFRRSPTDTAVNFVEDQSPLEWCPARTVVSFPATLACFNRRLQRQHHPREFAPGGDLLHRAKRFAGIRRDEVLHLIETSGAPVPFLV